MTSNNKQKNKSVLSPQQLEDLQQQLVQILMRLFSQNAELNPTRYLNKAEACEYLRISNNTLDKWIHLGLPIIRVGGSVRFDKISIATWMHGQMSDGTMTK